LLDVEGYIMLKDSLLEAFIGPLNLPEMDHRAMENPISALYDLSEQVSDKAFHIRKNVWYSLLFVALWVVATFILLLATIANINPVGAIILFLILLSGIYTLRIIYFNYQFFDYFSRRYHAIRLVREDNPNIYVPGGSSTVERFLNHLRANYEPFARLIDTHPESIQFSAILRGISGGAYQFDAYIGIPGNSPILRSTNLPKAIIKRGYALFIKVFDLPPTMADITALEQTIHDITGLTCLPPRVIALTEGGTGILSEDIHLHITEKGATAKCRKGNYPYNVQVVTGVEGTYDFIPLISSEGLP